ncbi:MAG: phosphotransferase [Treponema sp.]|jgi:2-phospho-L-lactate guanylyltransferase|nr:phosphotransferase [Treponema sp.]
MNVIDLTPVIKSESFCSFLNINPNEKIDFELLGHGEYNINYIFRKPHSDKKLVLRVPMGSQMHLENQVRYEFEALRLLESSGRTPKPLYIDDTKTAIPYGFMIMEFLPGRSLRYENSDLAQAAFCLADIHNLEINSSHHLLTPENPCDAILDECNVMASHYLNSDLGNNDVKQLLSLLLESGKKIVEGAKNSSLRCLINTELNSGNFLVNDDITFLVDWEKPLYACPGQDLGHFLAPTTTLWKTESILTESEIQKFLHVYCSHSKHYSDPNILWQDTLPFFTITCLRGVTWCSMAWVEYQSPERVLKDAYTFEKIKLYTSQEFLERMKNEYLTV